VLKHAVGPVSENVARLPSTNCDGGEVWLLGVSFHMIAGQWRNGILPSSQSFVRQTLCDAGRWRSSGSCNCFGATYTWPRVIRVRENVTLARIGRMSDTESKREEDKKVKLGADWARYSGLNSASIHALRSTTSPQPMVCSLRRLQHHKAFATPINVTHKGGNSLSRVLAFTKSVFILCRQNRVCSISRFDKTG
jgi:hypothetical protein